MKTKVLKLATLTGIIEPIFYFLLVTSLGFAKHKYDFTKQYISELSGKNSPHKAITNLVSFILLGVSVILMSTALHQEFRMQKISPLPHALLLISGGSLVLLGLLPADSHKSGKTLSGKLHRTITFPAAVAMPAAMLIYSRLFAKNKNWKHGWPSFSALTAWFTLASGWLLLTNKHSSRVGLIQRIALGPPLLWMSAVSNKMQLLQHH